MKIIDITGLIYEGMWNYGYPGGDLKVNESNFDFSGRILYHKTISGMDTATGTFIETPAIWFGYNKSFSTDEIPLERIVNIDTYVLQIPYENLGIKDNKHFISREDIKNAEKEIIPLGSSILIGTGYGKNWKKNDFVNKSPFFKKDAMYYLLDKNPNILGFDFPDTDNAKNPENWFEKYYETGEIITICGCVNLEKISSFKVKMTVLPIKISKVSLCPARAIVIEQ